MTPAAAPLDSVALARLIAGHISLHACMAGMRMAAPLMALHEGRSPVAFQISPVLCLGALMVGGATGLSLVFWSVGAGVAAGARSAWRLRPPGHKR